jgi:peptidoglycan/xylan/chitin deacetylase (PgdA/CDA1 family)
LRPTHAPARPDVVSEQITTRTDLGVAVPVKAGALYRRVAGWVRSFCYVTGLLSLLHRWRNRDTLTVFMFHRVLPANSSEYAAADREFTLTTTGFDLVLAFIARHYHVVDAATVRAAKAGKARLPSCAGLITFDDGWRDTLDYAAPLLARRRLPALVLVPTELLDSESARWWQDAVVELMADATKRAALAAQLKLPGEGAIQSWRLSAAVAALAPAERLRLLAPYVCMSPPRAQMATRADLCGPKPRHLAFGAHGHSHAPLTESRTPVRELTLSRNLIQALGGEPAMAFPHGACTPALISAAAAMGFELIFTSKPALNPRSLSQPALGRLHVPENAWTCEGGSISPPRLASYLFFRPALR